VTTQTDLVLADGRTLHVYDAGADGGARDLAVLWIHGTPSIGGLPEPLLPAAARLGIRWVSYDRPGYGGSTPQPGRDMASAVGDIAAIADSLGIGKLAIMAHSGGGPYGLACGTLLADRVVAVVSVAGMAPYDADGLDWFAGMTPIVAAEMRAALGGRAAMEDYLSTAGFDPDAFTPTDRAALAGQWSWLFVVSGRGLATETGGWADDNLACATAWGYDPAQVATPVLVLHGDKDKMVPSSHGEWLASRCPGAELRLYPGEGHISVLGHTEAALDWVRDLAGRD
jgi:pimeloyl-ACP methyl ester carboxylesterase